MRRAGPRGLEGVGEADAGREARLVRRGLVEGVEDDDVAELERAARARRDERALPRAGEDDARRVEGAGRRRRHVGAVAAALERALAARDARLLRFGHQHQIASR